MSSFTTWAPVAPTRRSCTTRRTMPRSSGRQCPSTSSRLRMLDGTPNLEVSKWKCVWSTILLINSISSSVTELTSVSLPRQWLS
uniref:Uncharacterized protein n=1 Tax=Arundo donax TaxID=35708 RepID=A0A0A9CVQ3_ARUDO